LWPSSNRPPLPTQRTTSQRSSPQLAVPFGFNTNKGEYRCSALGELQPLRREGSRVETANVWHVSSFSLDLHPPSSLCNGPKQLTFDLRHKRDISNGLSRGQANYQTKWHWQVHYAKLFGFVLSQKDTSVAQHGRISRGRERRHHALQVLDDTHRRCSKNAKSNQTCPKLLPR
jgi:hypothetical protein